MQAAPVHPSVRPLAAARFALRAVETLLLSAGQRTARRNAWSAVQEDRRAARDRAEALSAIEAVSGRSSQAT
ncbi:hypothetical protein [Streptomyces fuscigenes]|uniref:hypothetical protein n=1 Tax=Streptomyces fuscigenes TaxID=1528880 RepID=UPI001F1D5950|nr:hypothetical protein [Streptomyces fuscigenes]MCF3962632.1 hypothetical protein [Streptomyces fuscigenes]